MESILPFFGLVPIACIIAWSVPSLRQMFVKDRLPTIPPFSGAFGTLPAYDLSKYYAPREVPIDHLVLLPTLLEFCSASSGRLTRVFNFLVEAIERIEFHPAATPPGSVPPGVGLLTIYTPSGQTMVLASGALAEALHQAMARARG